jgi:hypothetical protein
MRWLQDNPIGMILAGLAGFLVLLALGMSIVWTLPVTALVSETDQQEDGTVDSVVVAHQMAAIDEFEVINQKPVFNETRQPALADIGDNESQEDSAVEIKGAPDVRLTGVIITPNMKIASLTPSDGNSESVMAHEGQALTGDFVGWLVSSVSPRNVVLESRDGQKLELDLQVHDVKIMEPPKPVVEATPEPDQAAELVNEDGQPMSRADQIRQRIAERREELRREQEEQQDQGGTTANESSQAAKPPDYQSAIRALMRNKSKEESSDDNKDE